MHNQPITPPLWMLTAATEWFLPTTSSQPSVRALAECFARHARLATPCGGKPEKALDYDQTGTGPKDAAYALGYELFQAGCPLTGPQIVAMIRQHFPETARESKDSARLDWLDGKGRCAKFTDGWSVWIPGQEAKKGPTLRDAIDVAAGPELSSREEVPPSPTPSESAPVSAAKGTDLGKVRADLVRAHTFTGYELDLIMSAIEVNLTAIQTDAGDGRVAFSHGDPGEPGSKYLKKFAVQQTRIAELEAELEKVKLVARGNYDSANAYMGQCDQLKAQLAAQRVAPADGVGEKILCLVGYIQYLMKRHPLDDYAEIPLVCKEAEEFAASLPVPPDKPKN